MNFRRFADTVTVLGMITLINFPVPVWAKNLQIGDAPKLVVVNLNGESFDLTQKQGKWVIVHFFATWCPGCKTEFPQLVQLYQKYHSKNLELIAVSPEPARKKNEITNFMKTYPLPAAMLADAKTNDFGSSVTLPTTYLIDPKGRVQSIFTPDEKGKAFDPTSIEKSLN